MPAASFSEMLHQGKCILGEGAVIERLRRDPAIELDPYLVNSHLVYLEPGRQALAAICGGYLEIARRFDLPLLLSTPTWRASRERIAAAGLADRDVNGDNFRFLDQLRKGYGAFGARVYICGLLSCSGDAYRPEEALSTADARDFHGWQAARLSASGVDFLLASTLPALSEATGLAQAMAATGLPYIVSFVARPTGTLLDGTPLTEAIRSIDAASPQKPLAYLVNCTHASVFRPALLDPRNSSDLVRTRVVGLLANTAALSPEELDNSEELIEEDPEVFGRSVAALRRELGMQVLGGCCGTDERHIESLARHLVEEDGVS
ncbi:homocysteine methyltransferase [Geomonas limicola]|uniref:Homocysteine methyltransferase n=1 Tax=Geomonas limicola TaxID=2740186 RepID=A0A6V8NC51_9BACT|nr:homocysteine S-methyltransferase family protein [Geomonas limicola]GFO69123.1 homocysteine methyltransferase [Geomonas limicola]